MVKLEHLSEDLILLIMQILNSQDIVKYMNYREKNPLSQPDLALPATSLLFKNINPYPFDTTSVIEDDTQVRVYFPSGQLQSREIVADIVIYFDIIVAKTLWLVNDGQPKVRPYEIMKDLINLFSDKSIGTLGKLHFNRFVHVSINERFNGIRIDAKITQFGAGK